MSADDVEHVEHMESMDDFADDGTSLQSEPLTPNADLSLSASTSVTSGIGDGADTPLRKGKKRAATPDATESLLRMLVNRKQPSALDFLPPKPKDNLAQFFESIASTMRTLPPVSIARLKLKISQLVGEEEIAVAESNALADSSQSNVQFIYVTEQSQTGTIVTNPTTNDDTIDANDNTIAADNKGEEAFV